MRKIYDDLVKNAESEEADIKPIYDSASAPDCDIEKEKIKAKIKYITCGAMLVVMRWHCFFFACIRYP